MKPKPEELIISKIEELLPTTTQAHAKLGTIKPQDLGYGWLEVAAGREVVTGCGCAFGFAEENIVLLVFKSGEIEVGIGEAMRPYQELYKGKDIEKAIEKFGESVLQHCDWRIEKGGDK